MTIIGYIIVGCIIGPLARLLVPGEDPMPWWATILVGIGGALIGGLLFEEIITPDNSGVPWIASVLGAVLLVLGLRFVRSRRA